MDAYIKIFHQSLDVYEVDLLGILVDTIETEYIKESKKGDWCTPRTAFLQYFLQLKNFETSKHYAKAMSFFTDYDTD